MSSIYIYFWSSMYSMSANAAKLTKKICLFPTLNFDLRQPSTINYQLSTVNFNCQLTIEISPATLL